MKTAASSRIPVLMSAFVCPGAGQFMQKRWLAGLIYLAGFLASFFWLMVLAVSNIIDYYKMAFEYESHDPHPHSPMALLLPFGVALFLSGQPVRCLSRATADRARRTGGAI
jgi:hypothetical protein